MRRLHKTILLALAVLIFGLLSANVNAAAEQTAETQGASQQRDWEFVLVVYGWMADLEATAPNGANIDISFSDIMDNLDFTFMSAFGVRKNRWSFMVDAIYLDLDDNSNSNINEVLKLTDVYLKNWIINPYVSYQLLRGEKGSLHMLAGARYFWLDTGLEIRTRPPLPPEKVKESGKDDVWDAVVGIKGELKLAERWFIPYVLDIGGGNSDYTYQAMAGIGYQFEKFELLAVYRYMHWEFDNNFSLLDELTVKGPAIGARFTF